SRTTIAMNFWLALLAAVLATAGFSWRPRWFGSLTTIAGFGALVFGLVGAMLAQERGWVDAWRFEQDVIGAVPAQTIGKMGAGGWLLVDLPEPKVPVDLFGNFWSISGMLL